MFLGMGANIVGGILADKYSSKNYKALSYISMGGSLIALPFAILAFSATNNFWLSIFGITMMYGLGEGYGSPSITMV